MTDLYPNMLFCLDSDALIDFVSAGRFNDLELLVQQGSLRVPLGVYGEVYAYERRKPVKNALERWRGGQGVVIDLDQDEEARALLPSIERDYGPPFSLQGITYRGFWKSKSGRDAADGEVVALAKAHGWTVIANDSSIHGACLLEDIACYRWEYLARLVHRRHLL